MDIFDYQSEKSGNSQGILIHVLGMNPVHIVLVEICFEPGNGFHILFVP